MKRPYRIILTEDHTILRQGLRVLLSSDPDFKIVGEAEDGRESVRLAETLLPDLILMDLSMPKMTGMDAIIEIKKRSTDTKIVVLTVHRGEEYVLSALKAGADGYVLKDANHGELTTAIRKVLEGKRYLSPDISGKVIEGYLEGKNALRKKTSWDTLTPREREILKLIAEGYKNREMAEALFISPKTVQKHRANLMEKLDLHNTAALTVFAIEKGIVDRE
jgi:two-component system response regulator NreC